MRNYFYLLFVLMLMTSCISGPKSETDREKLQLKGKVKNLITYTYDAHEENEELIKDSLLSCEVSCFTEEGKIWYITCDGVCVYDTINTEFSMELYENGVYAGERVYSYTNWGEIRKIVHYGSTGSMDGLFEYQYNDQRQRIEYRQYFNEVWMIYTNFVFNSQGLTTDYEEYWAFDKQGEDGEFRGKWHNAYNKEGLLIKQEMYDADGDIHEYMSCSFEYNKEGFLQKEILDNSIIECTYEYDEIGNYVKCKRKQVYHSGECSGRIFEREIEYYE